MSELHEMHPIGQRGKNMYVKKQNLDLHSPITNIQNVKNTLCLNWL